MKMMLEALGFPIKFVNWVMACLTTVNYTVLINGAPTPPFQGQKGLRQGDPMSPFLFAIGMEYLSRCLAGLGKQGGFKYHPKCGKLGLTHMMFADDLLMFCRADSTSVSILYKAFQEFSKASGLEANLNKSEVYFGGVTAEEQCQIQQCLPVPKGQFPFRYLGVPLSHKKLTYIQCKPLVDKVTARIQCWSAKSLSYAGRIQLIRSVIFGMQSFWAQIFIMPKKIIKEIESICRVFLWTGKTGCSRRALVAWDQVCRPKAEGGWNLINMAVWNQAASLKLLWNLASKADKMWVRWVHTYYIKNQNIWDFQVPSKCTWNLKRILKGRQLVNGDNGWQPFLKNGEFSIQKAYMNIRPAGSKVSWCRVIHNNAATPKSRFICWLAAQNRLPTADKLTQWTILDDDSCRICGACKETVTHLFFECQLTAQVWQACLNLLNIDRSPMGWDQELQVASRKAKGTKAANRVYIMVFVECVYAIWNARNKIVFDNVIFDVTQLIREIVERVRLRCHDKWTHILGR